MAKPKNPRKRASKTRPKRKETRVTTKLPVWLGDVPAELDLAAGAPFAGQDLPATMKIPQDIQELFEPLVEMATNAWRLKARMVDPDSGEPKEETRKLYRFVEAQFRALAEAGIQVIDKRGKRYDDGMSEEVVLFDQVPGLLKNEIIETIRPSIRWKEQLIHRGEIIVGTPVIETALGETAKPETAAISPELDSIATQTVESTETPPSQREGAPDPDDNASPELPESDAVVPERQGFTTQSDSGPDQPEAVICGNPSGQEAEGRGVIGGIAEEESPSAEPEHTQEQECLVDPRISAQPETREQTKDG